MTKNLTNSLHAMDASDNSLHFGIYAFEVLDHMQSVILGISRSLLYHRCHMIAFKADLRICCFNAAVVGGVFSRDHPR